MAAVQEGHTLRFFGSDRVEALRMTAFSFLGDCEVDDAKMRGRKAPPATAADGAPRGRGACHQDFAMAAMILDSESASLVSITSAGECE